MTDFATTSLMLRVRPQYTSFVHNSLVVLLILSCIGCASSSDAGSDHATPAAQPTRSVAPVSVKPAAHPSVQELLHQPNPAAAILFGSGFIPAPEQWVGHWSFLRSGFHVDITETKGKLGVSVRSQAGTGGVSTHACRQVVAAAELSCVLRGPDSTEAAIALRPGGSAPGRLEVLTLLVGGMPIDLGERSDQP